MLLDGRFELLALVPGMGDTVLQARDRETGASVLIRFFEKTPPIEAVGAAGVIKIGAGPGVPILISEDTPQWRAWRPGLTPASSSQPAGPSAGPGEFTRLFQGGAFPAQAPAPPLPTPARSVPPQPAQPRAAAPSVGEFTRLFKPPPAAPEPSPSQFPPMPPRASQGQTMEFDNFFRQPMAANPEALSSPPLLEPEVPTGKPFAGPSDFTKFFGDSPAPTPPPAARPGDSTSLFSQAPPTPAAPFTPEVSEYTRFLESESAHAPMHPTPPPMQSVRQPAPLPPVRQSTPGWVVALLAGVTLVVCLWLLQMFVR